MPIVSSDGIVKTDIDKRGRILIVEGSPLYTNLIKVAVKNVFSGPVDTATNFDDVKRLTVEHSGEYFLALLNLALPGAAFGEAVSYVRTLDIPSIVFTGSIEAEIVERIRSYGVIDYIFKENIANLELVSRTVRRLDQNRRTNVLLTDDSSLLRAVIRPLLEKHMFIVTEAEDGVEALELLKGPNNFHLLIVDYVMPKMNGFELIKEVRSFKNSRELAIVGMSAKTDGSLAANFIRFGADDFVNKPINPEIFATRIAMCMDKKDMLNELMLRATTDYLTKLWNRRHFMNTAKVLYSSSVREQIHITIVMIDLDFFKAINDTYGHEAGDEVLREVSAGLKARTRESDVLARIGGEEFCLLAINVEPKSQESFLNDILETISSITFNFDGVEVSVSASMGVTTELGTSLDDMMIRADNALYKAKEQGRARFVLAE